jgi:OTU domain-containing protein 6
MEDLIVQHRKEQRELQSKITQKKKSASKKTRKGVNEECTRLEDELKEKQAAEIAALSWDKNGESKEEAELLEEKEITAEPTNETTEALSSLSLNTTEPTTPLQSEAPDQQQHRKPNRQKARLARRAAEQAEVAMKAEEEAKNQPDPRAREKESMLAAFKARGLKEKEIRADGHCLYSAVADQLTLHHIGLAPRISPTIAGEEAVKVKEVLPYKAVRRTTAEYIKANADEFEPFLEEPLHEYVRKVGETAEWGGQLELMALAKAYGVKISVLDGNGSVHEIEGSDGVNKEDEKRIWLAYYRHGFGLGEHYNSLREG